MVRQVSWLKCLLSKCDIFPNSLDISVVLPIFWQIVNIFLICICKQIFLLLTLHGMKCEGLIQQKHHREWWLCILMWIMLEKYIFLSFYLKNPFICSPKYFFFNYYMKANFQTLTSIYILYYLVILGPTTNLIPKFFFRTRRFHKYLRWLPVMVISWKENEMV